jgi:hypothetical protein
MNRLGERAEACVSEGIVAGLRVAEGNVAGVHFGSMKIGLHEDRVT